MDRAHHDFLGNPDRTDGLHPHGLAVLSGSLSRGDCRSGVFSDRHRVSVSLVSQPGPR